MTSDQALNFGILGLLVATVIALVAGEAIQRWRRR